MRTLGHLVYEDVGRTAVYWNLQMQGFGEKGWNFLELGVVLYTHNSSTQKAEAGE